MSGEISSGQQTTSWQHFKLLNLQTQTAKKRSYSENLGGHGILKSQVAPSTQHCRCRSAGSNLSLLSVCLSFSPNSRLQTVRPIWLGFIGQPDPCSLLERAHTHNDGDIEARFPWDEGETELRCDPLLLVGVGTITWYRNPHADHHVQRSHSRCAFNIAGNQYML